MQNKKNIKQVSFDKSKMSNEKVSCILSQHIRKMRKQKGLSQSDVAFKIGIEASSYGQMERNAGKCSFLTLLKISIAFGISFIHFIDLWTQKKLK